MAQPEFHRHLKSETPGDFVFRPEEIYQNTTGKEQVGVCAEKAAGEFLVVLGLSALTNLVLRNNKFRTLATLSVVALGLKFIAQNNEEENILLPFPPAEGRKF